MALSQSEFVEVKKIRSKGRGVFAKKFIPEGTEIERVPVIVFPNSGVWSADGASKLVDYVFMWGKETVALALGYGSLYNHSYAPNACYDDLGQLTKVFTAIRDIQSGEEVTVNYNGSPEDQADVGFSVV